MTAYYNENDAFMADWLRGLIAADLIAPGEVDERSITDVRADDLRGFAQCHFFAGAGIWGLGLRGAGWPDDRPIWSRSCPCQPYSQAGARKGSADDRDLWPVWLRLIEARRPARIVGEQVASSEVVGSKLEADFVVAVQNSDFARANKLAKRLVASRSFHYFPRWIDRLQADLGREGYALRYQVLGAHSAGAFNRRQRVYWVADANKQGLERLARDGDGIAEPGREPKKAHGSCSASGDSLDWLSYIDGKHRPIPSGSKPLAYGYPRDLGTVRAGLEGMGFNSGQIKRLLREPRRILSLARKYRSGVLSGYGNAIHAGVAKAFCEMIMIMEKAEELK